MATTIGSPIQAYLERLHERHRDLASGEVATYIPELGKANPDWFGIAIATTDGQIYQVGDARQTFTIQSISKPITYGMALEDRGRDAVLAKVGVEPSGDAFNSISLDPRTGCPLNPMINAGAIATASLVAGHSAEDRLERLLAVYSLYAGHPLEIDEHVYRSEKETGHRNRAIGHMLRNFDVIECDPEPALDLYFRQCSILVDCRDLAVIAATLANGGLNPLTGERAVRHELVESILSVMTTCGMYDFAGEWVYAVGMPAKSGVAGGVLAVLPGQLGIGVFSPALDTRGNSVRGVAVCIDMSRDLGLHFLRVPRAASASLRGTYNLGELRSRRLRSDAERGALDRDGGAVHAYALQGDLSFAAVEGVVRRVVDHPHGGADAILDLRRVTHIDASAAGVVTDLVLDLAAAGHALVLVGSERHPAFARQLAERVATGGDFHALQRFTDLDAALEWCEERVLFAAQLPPAALPTLAEHDLCVGLGREGLAVLQPLLESHHYAPGELIVREGDRADAIFLLMEGRVSVCVDFPDGRRRRIATVSPGMVFGELTVVDRSPRTADVRADTQVECLALPAAALDRLAVTHPEIRSHILENLLRTVHRTVRRLSREVAALEA